MKNLIPYLVFPGTCKEALEFYSQCLSGEITSIMTFGESPMDVPHEISNRIFNADFKAKNLMLKASDDIPGYDVKMGTNMSLYMVFEDEETKKDIFHKLAEGGKIQFPIDDNFGMCKDKFGVQWMVVSE